MSTVITFPIDVLSAGLSSNIDATLIEYSVHPINLQLEDAFRIVSSIIETLIYSSNRYMRNYTHYQDVVKDILKRHIPVDPTSLEFNDLFDLLDCEVFDKLLCRITDIGFNMDHSEELLHFWYSHYEVDECNAIIHFTKDGRLDEWAALTSETRPLEDKVVTIDDSISTVTAMLIKHLESVHEREGSRNSNIATIIERAVAEARACDH